MDHCRSSGTSATSNALEWARWNIPTECDTIDRAGMDAEPHDPARVLIHDHQDPVGPQRCRLALEQIHAPEAVFHVAQERPPGGAIGVLSRPVVMSENPANHVFVDCDVERQGDLLGDSRTAPMGITFASFAHRPRIEMRSTLGPFGPGFRRR